jgi:hypothetical protein
MKRHKLSTQVNNTLRVTICESKNQEFLVTLYADTQLKYSFYATKEGLDYLRLLIDKVSPSDRT